MNLKYTVKANEYFTLRQVLKNNFNISNRLLTILKNNNLITLNNKTVYLDYKLNLGDTILVNLDFYEESKNIIPVQMKLNILYEDDCYIVINKPPFLPVHPSFSHYTDSLSNGLKYYYNLKNIHKKIRPINRIDKNTSRYRYICKK